MEVVDEKQGTRSTILKAMDDLGFTKAEFARLLVKEGASAQSQFNNWIAPNPKQLKKASEPVLRHIETLYLIKTHAPDLFEEIKKKVKK